MAVLYMTAGILFLFTDIWSEYITVGRGWFGGICIVYAAYRSTVIYRKIQLEKNKSVSDKNKAGEVL